MAGRGKMTKGNGKRVTRYTHENVKEPRSPETGHTPLLPADELAVTLPMDNGWSKAIEVGKLPEGDDRPVVVDMDPAADPVLFWAGKRNRREVPILPLQRNEIVSESRISQIIERARAAAADKNGSGRQGHLFADLEKALRETDKAHRVEFYTHDEGWKNKLICGDSLHVTESLLHYEGLRGKVQMTYIDPPYGIRYDSNFQQRVDSTKNDEKDQADDVLSIKAFRDTWALGIHSYLSYLHERLYLSRELLADSGSIFVQIGVENMHVVRAVMDEVFGAKNCVGNIIFMKTAGKSGRYLDSVYDALLWYAKDIEALKYRQLFVEKSDADLAAEYRWLETPDGSVIRLSPAQLAGETPIPAGRRFRKAPLNSQGESGGETSGPITFKGHRYAPPQGRHWTVPPERVEARLIPLGRIIEHGNDIAFKRYADDFDVVPVTDVWRYMGAGGFVEAKWYVVQTPVKVVERCLLLSTDPGDLVFDPTCGSGTTAYCAEKYGRRWITCDTARVAINVARQRLLAAVFDHFRTRNGKVSGGFIYKRVKRVTPKSLAYDLEPEEVELFDQPEADEGSLRVAGPFEVMSVGRYSADDWKGYVINEGLQEYGEAAKLENYIGVICRLYRENAAVQGTGGLVHAVAESKDEKIAISVGPLSGRVTAKQISDAVQDALAAGMLDVHVLGWAFEANVGEVKSQLESRGRVKIQLVMIRPDTLAGGLKITQPEMLFSPLALPDVEVEVSRKGKNGPEALVRLKGVALFDRKTRATAYKAANSGYVAAWYLDEDYDGDCFVDCQMFFDFKKAPNLKAALKAEIDPEEFKFQAEARPFPVRGYKRIAVKVVDVFGNESTVVKALA